MMQLTAAMVGMLGGPALQVLMVLAIEQEWRSIGFLQDMANLSEKTVHQATRKLVTLGYITERTMSREKSYRITGDIYQLPLATVELEAGPVDSAVDNSAEESSSSVNFTEDALNESMNQSDSIDIDDSLIDSYGDRSGKTGAEGEVTAAELRGFGFYGRGLQDLLAIRGLTLREVRYHVKNCPTLGGALWRLKKRQGVPASFEADVGQGGEENPYLGGKYADFVVH